MAAKKSVVTVADRNLCHRGPGINARSIDSLGDLVGKKWVEPAYVIAGRESIGPRADLVGKKWVEPSMSSRAGNR